MKQRRSSTSAMGMALIRALETQKPSEQRIYSDPLAHYFAPQLLLKLAPLFAPLSERRAPGVIDFLIARARYIDDALISYIEQGIQQVVILGAGYDTRAYRLESLKPPLPVFEVDHPATQEAKLKRLREIGMVKSENVTYVPVDFMIDRLEKLFNYGYQPDLLTLFIWEGVTPYISAEAIDQTLAFVRQSARPGSAIIFDYMYAEALTSSHPRPEIAHMRRTKWLTGENLIFGIPEGTIETFLSQRGFTAIKNVSPGDLEQLYFKGKTPERVIAPIYAIVSARTRENM